ncbi:RES domain-containing protein [Azoarcus communis]|uniref:RES domain-containing protein n=1 Tax=Parazoarcus communis TaxID=41977 RepID=UPI001459330F|nr:RES domain-containing protein [Parazoarcus communis]
MSIGLTAFRIETGTLLQHVSRVVYRGKPLYFGRDGSNRYDAPARDYGVLYLGCDLPTALMESVFHKHQWDKDAQRSIALAEVQSRLVRAVGVLDELQLVDLTAEGVMAGYFGLNLEQLASRGYTHTQQVSRQVHAMQGKDGVSLFDGVRYPSRNNYPATSIALFERAEWKVRVIEDIDLPDHVGWPRFVADYRIGIELDPGLVEGG